MHAPYKILDLHYQNPMKLEMISSWAVVRRQHAKHLTAWIKTVIRNSVLVNSSVSMNIIQTINKTGLAFN